MQNLCQRNREGLGGMGMNFISAIAAAIISWLIITMAIYYTIMLWKIFKKWNKKL